MLQAFGDPFRRRGDESSRRRTRRHRRLVARRPPPGLRRKHGARPGGPAPYITADEEDTTSHRDQDEVERVSLDVVDGTMTLQHNGERKAGEARFIEITVDSKAADVAPPGFAQDYPTKLSQQDPETEPSAGPTAATSSPAKAKRTSR